MVITLLVLGVSGAVLGSRRAEIRATKRDALKACCSDGMVSDSPATLATKA